MTRLVHRADFAGSGRGVGVAVIDSGIHAPHPHVPQIAGSAAFDSEGRPAGDVTDRLGHGTAVAAAILEKAPEAEIYAVKVFDRRLETSGAALIAALQWSIGLRVDLVNVSLGTLDRAAASALAAAIADACRAGVQVVAAGTDGPRTWLPGCLQGVVAVRVDWTLPRETIAVHEDEHVIRVSASGYPRPIPGVPPERNLKGLSFAVANATGILALMREQANSAAPSPAHPSPP